jgi:hypothetical protein
MVKRDSRAKAGKTDSRDLRNCKGWCLTANLRPQLLYIAWRPVSHTRRNWNDSESSSGRSVSMIKESGLTARPEWHKSSTGAVTG